MAILQNKKVGRKVGKKVGGNLKKVMQLSDDFEQMGAAVVFNLIA